MKVTGPEQPVAVDQLARFDYATRAAALKLVHGALTDDPPHWQRADIAKMLATALDEAEVVRCIIAMAAAGFVEYFGGWDWEFADLTVSRELRAAEDLGCAEELPWAGETDGPS